MRITTTDFSCITRINYNSLSKELVVLISPSPIHNVHHGWMFQALTNLCVSGGLTTAENYSVVIEVGTCEYACVLFNSLA